MSESLSSLFTKERLWASCCCCSFQKSDRERIILDLLKKSDVSDSIVIQANRSKKRAIRWKKRFFCRFSPFLCQKSKSLPSLFTQSLFLKEWQEQFALIALYKRANVGESLTSFFTKEWLWAIRSGRLWQKSNGSNSLFFTSELLFRSFAYKKLVIRLKNWWANSQLKLLKL